MVLLSTAYFPPVEFFAVIANGMTLSPDKVIPSVVYLEAHENFQKQSYRNRCKFYGSEGVQTLQVPIVHEGGTHERPITEIKVDYSTPWIARTEKAIASAYDSSAYFEYYKDDIFAILDSRPERLWELNLELIRYFLKKTGIAADIRFTDKFTKNGIIDIHPKRTNTILKDLELEKPYFQVFARKHGFIPNLSIMDLLFNEGPDSILFLKKIQNLF